MSLYCEALAGCIELCKPASSVVRISRPAPTVHVMRNVGRSEVALRASAGLFVVMVGCGAAVVGAGASALAPDTTATNAMSSETPAPPTNPGGPSGSGGALPVVPPPEAASSASTAGAFVASPVLGPHPHHHPATTNGHPNVAPAAPRPGSGGG